MSSKKDPNTPCEEGRIEMTVYSLFEGTSVHCGELRLSIYPLHKKLSGGGEWGRGEISRNSKEFGT